MAALIEAREAAARLPALLDAVDVTDKGCWEWQRALSDRGYGRVRHDNRNSYAHRVLLQMLGTTPPSGWHIHHSCANPCCTNPQHLEALPPIEHRARHRRAKASTK
jgi:hypothetical protein